MNSFGLHFVFTSFGESHGAAIGGVLDGVPSGLHIDFNLIRSELLRRSGQGMVGASERAKHEPDEVEWLSGVLDGITLGTPVAFLIRNRDARPEDYEWLKQNYRPGHADKVYQQKYGIRDWRGGDVTLRGKPLREWWQAVSPSKSSVPKVFISTPNSYKSVRRPTLSVLRRSSALFVRTATLSAVLSVVPSRDYPLVRASLYSTNCKRILLLP